MKKFLEVKDIKLCYHSDKDEIEAIKNLSFSIEKGEFVSIIGPSGCGKTSILSIIAGLIKQTSGEVYLDNEKINSVNNNIGYMLQRDELFPWRTVKKNILLPLEIKKKLNSENISFAEELLEKYGLKSFQNKYPDQLSGGMRQRVALIRTLVSKPKLLLLDEPFSALDYQTKIHVCNDVLYIIKKEQKTAILVTHDISEALSMSDKILIMSDRPSKIKQIIYPDFGNISPLEKREKKEFGILFDRIFKELTNEKY